MKKLENEFRRILRNYAVTEESINILWDNVVRQYTPRFYHNLVHLEKMISELTELKSSITDWESLFLAVIYHDYIHLKPGKHNEEKSAVVAKHELMSVGYPIDKIKKVQFHILATKDHVKTECKDTNFLIDADMWRLGDKPFLFKNLSFLIREEYRIIPDKFFYPGRLKFLKELLNRDYIFCTPYFFIQYERKAVDNITNEIKELMKI